MKTDLLTARSPRLSLWLASLAAAGLLLPLGAARLDAQTTYTWNGGTGNWSDPTFWTTGVPNDANADVYIDGGKTGVNSVVTMNNSYTAGRLTVDAGDTLNLANNVSFYLASSFAGSESIINNGTINLNGTGNFTDLRFVGANASLTGTGTLNLTGANNRIFAQNGNGDRLTVSAGATIAGAGNLGAGQSTFTNNGTVNANLNGQTLTLQPSGGSSDFTNNGVAKATNGGVLSLSGGVFAGTGSFQALAGSTVTVGSGATVSNTTLTTGGTGEVHLTDTATFNNVTNGGTLIANDNTITYLAGTLTNNGTITFKSTGNNVDLRFVGSQTLAGNGTLNLTGTSSRVFASNGNGDRLTISAGSTIAGTGNLGAGQSTFTNNGVVNANVSGATLTLQPGGGNGDFNSTASGVTEASNGGTLVLQGSGSFIGGGGFRALTGSQVNLTGNPTLLNTTLTTVDSGVVNLLDTATLNNVGNSGTINAANGSVIYLTGTLGNTGTINVNGTTSFTDVRFVGSQSLTGNGGTLNLNGANDRVFANNGNGDRLTIGFGATIQGTGNLGVGQSTFTNNGQLNANINGATLTIQPGGGSGDFTTGSTGTTIAELGGKLVLTGGSFTNNGLYEVIAFPTGGSSSITVDAGHLTNFSGNTLTGGRYFVTSSSTSNTATLSFGGGTITTNAAAVVLAGANSVFNEINGLTNNQGTFATMSGRAFTTVAGLTNSGVVGVLNTSNITVTGQYTDTPAARLAGIGTINALGGFAVSGVITPGGTLSPLLTITDSVGTLTLGGTVVLESSAVLSFQLGDTSAGSSDHLNGGGALTLDGTLNLTALAGFGAGRYDLIDYTGVLMDHGLDLGTRPNGYTYAIDTSLAGQVDLVVTNNVPEPSTWVLLGVGVVGLGIVTLRCRRHVSGA